MKAKYLVLALAAIFVSASPAWSYRWGGYNTFGNGYSYGYGGLNALRYILPISSYRGNYNYNSYNGGYNRVYCPPSNWHHHHRRWW
ncbi:MAG: hypothetical protein WCT03_12440 [Candidatus Obscuribacterales bacterium]|jgi:hypothetical protein